MRIFHGLLNIAGIPSIMARAERALGADSTAVCFAAANPGYVPDVLEPAGFQASDHLLRFGRYASHYDVFVFHFGYSLAFDSLADVPLLKDMGKTVIFYFHGCDIRQSKENIRKYRFSACRECWPQPCNPNRDRALEVATRFADAIWVSTPDLLEFVPGSMLFPQPLDVRALEFLPKDSERIAEGQSLRIVHAPSDRMLKGTKYVLAAVAELQSQGLPIELDLIENLPHRQALDRCRQGDLVVEQLLIGAYGTFAAEMMAIGVPVICFLRDDLVPKYAEPPPIESADPSTIGPVIRDFITRRAQWPEISWKARMYVEKHHAAEAIAARSTAIYRSLRRGGRERLAAVAAQDHVGGGA